MSARGAARLLLSHTESLPESLPGSCLVSGVGDSPASWAGLFSLGLAMGCLAFFTPLPQIMDGNLSLGHRFGLPLAGVRLLLAHAFFSSFSIYPFPGALCVVHSISQSK